MAPCLACGSNEIVLIADLGFSPLANSHRDDKNRDLFHPLVLNGCKECTHLQIADQIQTSEIFNENYSYLSGHSSEWHQHCSSLVSKLEILMDASFGTNRKILEIGSNDGTLLSKFRINNSTELVLGIEPSALPAYEAIRKGIQTEIMLLDSGNAHSVSDTWGNFDLIVGTNVFAHTPNPQDLFEASHLLLQQDGYLVVEVQDGSKLLSNGLFDMVYHEHYSYFTPQSLSRIGQRAGFELLTLEKISTHGGSLRAIYTKSSVKSTVSHTKQSFDFVKSFDFSSELIDLNTASLEFNKSIDSFYLRVERELGKLSKENQIIGVGAPAKLTTFIHAAPTKLKELLLEKIEYVYDANSAKNGTYVPGTKIPIGVQLQANASNFYWIFSWNYEKELREILFINGVEESQIAVVSKDFKAAGELHA